jgi:predicted phage terminase large subunit-like protein
MDLTKARLFLDHLFREDMAAFAQKAFATVNPGQVFHDNWHIWAICLALTRVAQGETRRLLITLPPRHLKSHLVSVCFPAWVLARDPRKRIICSSYSADLAESFSQQTRTIVQQDWYRRIAPRMSFDPKRMTKDALWTTAKGFRIAISVGGSLTGKGGDILIIDDPMKADEANSESARRAAIEWYQTVLSSRFEDPKTVAIIVVAQRLHMDDLPGYLIAQGGWTHLNLPAEAWMRQKIEIAPDRFANRSPGDLLHPERFGPEELAGLRRELGSAAYQAQFNQRPVPPSGHMLQLKWFRRFELPLQPSLIERIYQSWDTALETGGTNDYSVCTTWAVSGQRLYLLDVFRARLEFHELQKKVVELRAKFKAHAVIVEKAGSGISLYQNLRRAGLGWIYTLSPKGDKQQRAAQRTPTIEGGLVYLPVSAPWLESFEHEIAAFPHGKYDDQVDSMVQFMQTLEDGRRHTICMGLSMYAG